MANDTYSRLNLDDLDPSLARLISVKLNEIRTSVWDGGESTRFDLRQKALRISSALSSDGSLRVTMTQLEQVDAAILNHWRRNERGGRFGVGAHIESFLFRPTLPFLFIAFNFIAFLLYINKSPGLDLRQEIGTNLLFCAGILGTVLVPAFERRRRRSPGAEVLAAILGVLPATEAEQLYCDAASQVLKSEDAPGTAEERAMLVALNCLLDSQRKLHQQGLMIIAAIRSETPDTLVRESDRLRARMEATQDAVAREALRESLRLCDSRLAQVRRMSLVLERIAAQEESIRQATASVQTSVAALTIASMNTFSSQETAGPQATLLETTRELQHRAYAVEKAVQEVATLKAG